MGSDEPPRFTDGFVEHRDEAGVPRHGYAELLDALEGVDLDQLCFAVAEDLERRKVTFGPRPFVVDPVPRLLEAAEWAELSEGLIQRTRALNRFLLDAYGDQKIVRDGVVSAEAIQEAEGFEPDLLGSLPQRGWPAAVIGFDVVRDPAGKFLVLEDNVRTPSGFAYALAARAALLDHLPPGSPRPRPIDPVTYDLLRETLLAAAPEGVEDPSIVVLTDGPDNVAFYEHEEAAARIGAPLVTPQDLIADGERLAARLPDGTRRVDCVYRRTDEDRVRDADGNLTDVARDLLPAWLSGNVGLVNAFGNGLADDKLIHGHVEDFIRFYLKEEPLISSVPTQALDTEAALRETLDTLEDLVVKPRHGHGGTGVVIGPHADSDDLDRLATELERNPERYITQPTIALSLHPTVIEGRLEPRHIDLRPFAFCAQDVRLPPGGLSRVAFDAGALVVNSSQDGGGKDTWVLDPPTA